MKLPIFTNVKQGGDMNLSRDMQLLSEVIGVDSTMKVIANLSGISLYIPKPDHAVIRYFHERIGGDPKRTAQQLGISERTVYRAIQEQKENDGQRTIFDVLAEVELSK